MIVCVIYMEVYLVWVFIILACDALLFVLFSSNSGPSTGKDRYFLSSVDCSLKRHCSKRTNLRFSCLSTRWALLVFLFRIRTRTTCYHQCQSNRYKLKCHLVGNFKLWNLMSLRAGSLLLTTHNLLQLTSCLMFWKGLIIHCSSLFLRHFGWFGFFLPHQFWVYRTMSVEII